MATITSPGVGSGLDVNTIVTSLIKADSAPLTGMNTQKASYQSKISAYGQINSALSALQTAVKNLSTNAKFNAQSVTSSDATMLTATSTDGTSPNGSYDISVSQLAQSQKLSVGGFASASDVVGTGTLSISFGKFDATATPKFAANADKQTLNITIDSTNNTLSGVRDAINASGASVTASIVNDGTTNNLVLTSKDTGEVNSMKITVNDSGDSNNTDQSGLSRLAFDPEATSGSGKNMTQIKVAQNALMTVDGLSISKPSNTITDAIPGLTLNLTKATTSPVTLNVNTDTSKIDSNVQAFVDAYNKFNSTIKSLTKFTDSGSKGSVSTNNGPLLGDGTARTIASQMSNLIGQNLTNGTSVSSLSQLGVTLQSDGSLSFDSTKFNKALASDPTSVNALFTSTKYNGSSVAGIASQLDSKITDMLSDSGILKAKTDGYTNSSKLLDQKISDFNDKLTKKQAAYVAQYSKLDVTISNMNNELSYVNQSIASYKANS